MGVAHRVGGFRQAVERPYDGSRKIQRQAGGDGQGHGEELEDAVAHLANAVFDIGDAGGQQKRPLYLFEALHGNSQIEDHAVLAAGAQARR